MSELVCHACGTRVARDEPIPRDAECGRCGADLRACRNCRHWDERYHNQCAETQADPVEDRVRRNFCEYFSYSAAQFEDPSAAESRAAEARAKLDALFGGKPASPAPDREADARARLEALFRKGPGKRQ